MTERADQTTNSKGAAAAPPPTVSSDSGLKGDEFPTRRLDQQQRPSGQTPLTRRTPEQVRRLRQEAYLGKVRQGREEKRWESRSEQVS